MPDLSPVDSSTVDISTVDLSIDGSLLGTEGKPVGPAEVPSTLKRLVVVDERATDIIVFVHGWQTRPERAEESARRLARLVASTHSSAPARYPGLTGFAPQYIAVRWPSRSSPLPGGYRKIRDRARAMTDRGAAATVLATLLGYVNDQRRPPSSGPDVLRTRGGQYLHCVGHSFGGRFLGYAIARAAAPPPTLAWPWHDHRYPYVVDSLLVFQMAMPRGAFGAELKPLLTDAPINGPIVLTHSRHDRALGFWHKIAEKGPGIGYCGAEAPPELVKSVCLHEVPAAYTQAELTSRIVNVDATWRYAAHRVSPPGSHSDYFHAESAHLLLSLADFSR